MSVLFSIFAGIVMFAASDHISAIFLGSGETEILALSHLLLKVHGMLYIILALLFIFRFSLQGFGKSFVPTLAGVMELVMRFLAAFVLIPYFEFLGAAISTPLSWLGALIPVAIAYCFVWNQLKKQVGAEEKSSQLLPLQGACQFINQ